MVCRLCFAIVAPPSFVPVICYVAAADADLHNILQQVYWSALCHHVVYELCRDCLARVHHAAGDARPYHAVDVHQQLHCELCHPSPILCLQDVREKQD